MDLILTDEQRMLQDSAGRMLAQLGGVKRMRPLKGRGSGYDRAVHGRFAEEGWLGILVPQERGGLGLGVTELALVLGEAGRVLAPEPIAPVALAAWGLAQGQRSDAVDRLIEEAVAGTSVFVPAIEGDGSAADATLGKVEARRSAAGVVLHGVRDGVAAAVGSDGFLVAAASAEGPLLVHVPSTARGVSIESGATVDGRPISRLRLDAVAGGTPIIGPNAPGAPVRGLYDLLLVSAAAELVGAMGAALDMTVDYLKTRKQFGKPIGSFQALQHRAVDDYTRIVSSRALLFQIAAQGPGLTSQMASALKAHVGGEALKATKSAIQMHGAIGFTDEHDIGLYLKRAMNLSAWLGNEAHHRKRYAVLSA